MDSSIYREQIIDLYENPMNFGSLEPNDFTYEEDNRVAEVAWSGDGCAISQASASLLTEEIKGMTLDEIRTFPKEKLLELIGVQLSMARVKCALLSLKVLKAGAYGLPGTDTMRNQE